MSVLLPASKPNVLSKDAIFWLPYTGIKGKSLPINIFDTIQHHYHIKYAAFFGLTQNEMGKKLANNVDTEKKEDFPNWRLKKNLN